ncbi:hypothetical protein QTG54_014117 [Skeletonema marinoi]|uniref:Uncharacterized protein n=1 Tax=Skeletonema marinoi TaxID=267567 RepID=A0AAD8XWB0_9STRA|nr:hypothetical protein QTG54_014117 [Skeletonema marinoi]
MEVLSGDLENATSQIDIACVSNGAYIFTVYDESGKCCGDNKGYYAVKVNGEEVVRGRSYFTSPNAYIIGQITKLPLLKQKYSGSISTTKPVSHSILRRTCPLLR